MIKKTISSKEVEEIYGISTGTLANMRYLKKIYLPYYKIGKKVMYKVDDIEKWLYQKPIQAEPEK